MLYQQSILVDENIIDKYKKIDVSNKWFSFGVAPELGGKILSFLSGGVELFFCIDKFDYIPKKLEQESNVADYRKKLKYLPAGGYKAWLSPQEKWGWPPYLDLETGIYEYNLKREDEKVEINMKSPICRESGMKIERNITISTANELLVNEKIINCGEAQKEYGIWSVTQLKREGTVIFPIGKEKKLVNLGNKSFDENIEYIYMGEIYYAVIHCRDRQDFKIGTNYSEGWILSIIKSEKIYGYLKRFPQYESSATFGHGCAVEVYNSPAFDYFEVEVHAPVTVMHRDESAETYEKWSVHQWESGTSYEEIIKKI